MDLQSFFLVRARLSRRAVAEFAQAELEDVDQAAAELGYGQRLALDEVEELITVLDDSAEDDSDQNPGDEEE